MQRVRWHSKVFEEQDVSKDLIRSLDNLALLRVLDHLLRAAAQHEGGCARLGAPREQVVPLTAHLYHENTFSNQYRCIMCRGRDKHLGTQKLRGSPWAAHLLLLELGAGAEGGLGETVHRGLHLRARRLGHALQVLLCHLETAGTTSIVLLVLWRRLASADEDGLTQC